MLGGVPWRGVGRSFDRSGLRPESTPMTAAVAKSLSYAEFTGRIYAGEILKFRDLEPFRRLLRVTTDFCEHALAPDHPTRIHEQLDESEQIERLGELRRRYTKLPEVRCLWAETFQSIGLHSGDTARDRLTLRLQTHHDDEATHSANTATAPVPLHRGTWGSNLYAQINWWAPVYALISGRTLALYPQVFDQALRNSTVTGLAKPAASPASNTPREPRRACGCSGPPAGIAPPVSPSTAAPTRPSRSNRRCKSRSTDLSRHWYAASMPTPTLAHAPRENNQP